MNQSSSIAASLVIAFFVFIVVRGQFPCYLEVLGITTHGQCGFGTISGAAYSGGFNFSGGGSGSGVSVGVGGGGIGIGIGGVGIGIGTGGGPV